MNSVDLDEEIVCLSEGGGGCQEDCTYGDDALFVVWLGDGGNAVVACKNLGNEVHFTA